MKRINQNVDTTLCDTFIQISCRTIGLLSKLENRCLVSRQTKIN